jgi:CDP-glucose 4,6-dehydratase
VLEPLSGYVMLGKALYEGKVEMSEAWNFGPHGDSFVSVEVIAQKALDILGKGTLSFVPDHTKHEATLLKLDINKAIATLGWKPSMKFQETLEETFGWYKCYYEQSGEDVVAYTKNQITNFFIKNT